MLLGERAKVGGVEFRAEGEVESDSPWSDRRRSPSDSLAWFEDTLLLAGVARRFGDEEGDEDDMAKVEEGSQAQLLPAACCHW